MIRRICIDIDETLLNSQKEIPEENIAAKAIYVYMG